MKRSGTRRPWLVDRIFEQSTESAKYQRQLFRSFRAPRSFAHVYQGRRASRCSALAPGFHIPRLRRSVRLSYSTPLALSLAFIFRAFGSQFRCGFAVWYEAGLGPLAIRAAQPAGRMTTDFLCKAILNSHKERLIISFVESVLERFLISSPRITATILDLNERHGWRDGQSRKRQPDRQNTIGIAIQRSPFFIRSRQRFLQVVGAVMT